MTMQVSLGLETQKLVVLSKLSADDNNSLAMEVKAVEIEDLFVNIERFFSIGGIWPTKRTYFKFAVCVVYFLAYLAMAYADLFYVLGDLELMVMNLVETLVYTMTFPMLLTIRASKSLTIVIAEVKKDIKAHDFESIEEKKIYHGYNYVSKMFFRISVNGIMATITSFYFRPLINFVVTDMMHDNDTASFVLPFRIRIFFDVNKVSTYTLVYIYLMPMIYLSTCHMVSICVLVILVLHICGKLSILSYRIRNITIQAEQSTNDDIRRFIKMHLKVMRMAKSLDDTFNLILLDELLGNSITLAISLYNVLMNTNMSDMATFLSFMLYAFTALVMLYGYCLVGDQLIQESMNVHDSIYQSNWLKMSKSSKRSLLICMIHAQTPLRLTAGKFYVFSLNSFTEVVKSSLAYVSVLRTLL